MSERLQPVAPGSADFRAFLLARFPRRPAEPLIKGYFQRLCRDRAFREAGITVTRLRDLWYGAYGHGPGRFRPGERAALFGGGEDAPPSAAFIELQTQLANAHTRQRDQNERMLRGIRELLRVLEETLSH